MREVKIQVRERIATWVEGEIVCDNTDYKIIFDFDDEWNSNATKTLRVKYGDAYTEVVFVGNEVVTNAIYDVVSCKIGVYSGHLQTTTPAIVRNPSATYRGRL